MGKKIITFAAFLLLSLTAFSQSDNSALTNEPVTGVNRMEELTEQKKVLLKQIKIEDSKRNKVDDSMSFEQMEEINDRQDSICLDLRSKMVYVELEINELKRNDVSSVIRDKIDKINKN